MHRQGVFRDPSERFLEFSILPTEEQWWRMQIEAEDLLRVRHDLGHGLDGQNRLAIIPQNVALTGALYPGCPWSDRVAFVEGENAPGSWSVLVIGTVTARPTQRLVKSVTPTIVLTAFFVICAPAFTSMHFSSCNSSGHYSLTRQRALRVIAGGSALQIFGIDMRDLSPSQDCGKTDLMLIN